MKITNMIIPLSLLITSCGDSESLNQNIKALNGTWAGMCNRVNTNVDLSVEYAVSRYEFINGNYTNTFTSYSDIDCINDTASQKEIGAIKYIEEVLTQSGLTASKVQFEVINSYRDRPQTYETLIYIDSNNLYFGAFLEDLNVLFLSGPHMKVN